jgi:ComF family protein
MTAFQITSPLRAGIARLFDMAADALSPAQCLTCRVPVQQTGSLCSGCWIKLTLIEEPCCDRLGLPFSFEQGEGAISPAALANPPPWNRARSAVAFNETSRALVHALKYQDRHEARLLMARLMRRAARPFLETCDAVIPVPLHWRRLWTRRFNQSALLAQMLAREASLPYRPELLERVRPTPQQVGLDPKARQRNVKNAFAVPEAARLAVAGRRLLLIDDVLTTGATLSAATAALQKAGPAEVNVVTFALVITPGRSHIPSETKG